MNNIINDFGIILDNWDQVLTHRITYYTKPNKGGISISCPACFSSDNLVYNAALFSDKGKHLKKGCKEIVISKYDYTDERKLYDIKVIEL